MEASVERPSLFVSTSFMGFYSMARRLLWYIDYMGSYAKHLTCSLLPL